ncbi:1-deoxy-D-xylulose-5-phosphate synthase [Candidatus Izimaplasma bacterium ZiA1]|uniref:1-deoxy-D-xylulose-5-phosphate synthase n=1 Tax=Candidatus Izimoplasma sp. ZiA1 TaxID=2024899 RepID=UPI000BAA395A|nr:1-deoxy-D-xylulose-5-phosphate synthase [Candidatus Izimaplasma bacterium ZiA1]
MIDLLNIKDPSFVKSLSEPELVELAQEIREFLIENISKTGGHLSSNLGVVELSIALHYIFDSPKDKIVFDVGHQSYTHKILTGRAKDFPKLRKYQGLSGFLKRSESVHDVYEAGHSSTSLAAVAGIEFSKQYCDEIGKVIGVIGDGALSGGMAFEALNFIGSYNEHQPIIIVNDNEMSISENTGVIANTFNSIKSKKGVRKIKSGIDKITPKFARPLTSKVERSIKAFVSSNTLFDDLGFTYYGPINGHDFKALFKYLQSAKLAKRPSVIHIVTEKGRGYKYSEEDKQGSWHGVGPFDIETGKMIKHNEKNMHSFSTIIAKYMEDYAKNNENFNIVIPAMIPGCSLSNFKELYPKRINDVGIAEQMAVTMASGYAISGVKVFTPIYSTFIQRAYDQINHDCARQKLPVVFGIDRAGIVGADGETHQGIYDIPLLRHIPNMVIAMGKDAEDTFKICNYAFNQTSNPIVIRYPRENTYYDFENEITKEAYQSTAWEYLQTGKDLTFISFGPILDLVKETYRTNSIKADVINARFLKPLDEEVLKAVLTSNKPVLIYEESIISGGFASSILEYAALNNLSTSNIHIMAIPEMFVEQGTRSELLRSLNMDIQDIMKKTRELLS